MQLRSLLKQQTETSTTKAAETVQKADPIEKLDALMQGDVYIGSDTVGELASGVPDRVFFATNETILTTASRETLKKTSCMVKTKLRCNYCSRRSC